MSNEILINATLVSQEIEAKMYEFVINNELEVVECVYIESLADGVIAPVSNFRKNLKSELFELNHVRVNPRVDNTTIISTLTNSLKDIGVNIENPPGEESMAVCYKPLGEISDNVRFYFHEDAKLIFLSPAIKPKIISTQNQTLSQIAPKAPS